MLSFLIDNHLVDYVAMDIKHTKEKYNSIACMTHFDISPIEASVTLLKQGRVAYEFRTTIMKECHEASDMEDIGNWLRGADAYYLQSYKESEQVINPVFSAHSKATLESFVNILKPYVQNTQLRGID